MLQIYSEIWLQLICDKRVESMPSISSGHQSTERWQIEEATPYCYQGVTTNYRLDGEEGLYEIPDNILRTN